jgi:2-dehydropantoate 2-reductase
MGCLYGGMLAHRGEHVTLVDVSAEHIEAINRDGLLLERDGDALTIPVPAGRADDVTSTPDLVILFTKTLHTTAALESARPFLGEGTLVLSLQNGLGNDDLIARFVPRERIILGITTFPADLIGPGRVRSLGSGVTRIMAADGRLRPELEPVRISLDGAGFNCEISPEVTAAIWEKVAFNVAMNSLTAVMRLPVGAISDSPEARQLAGMLVDEVVAVAAGKGIPANREDVLATVAGALAGHREHKPSMLQDVLAGRRTEVDSLNGAVVREARALGLPVPATEVLYLLVRAVEETLAS